MKRRQLRQRTKASPTAARAHAAQAAALPHEDHPVAALLLRWQWVIIAFVASRLLIFTLMFLSRLVIVPGERWQRGGFVDVLTQGSGSRYLDIVTTGYSLGGETVANIGFFPLYPAIVWIFSLVFRDPAVSAIFVSNVALLGAGILLKELIDLHYNQPRVSSAAVTFLMFSPVSFFFSGPFAEPVILMFALAACFGAATHRWSLAAVSGMCVAAASPVGFLILVPLAVEYVIFVRNDRTQGGRTMLAGALGLLLVPLGCALFLGLSYVRFGDALAPLRRSELWAHGFVAPWTAISATTLIPPFYRSFALLILCVAVAVWIAGVFLKIRWSYLLYAGALIVACACSPALPGIARHLSVAFPLFIILGVLTRRVEWLYEPLLAGSFTLLAFCTILITNGHWFR